VVFHVYVLMLVAHLDNLPRLRFALLQQHTAVVGLLTSPTLRLIPPVTLTHVTLTNVRLRLSLVVNDRELLPQISIL
jgi:hypothetical protein